jgi:hypothetical protein
MIDVVDKSLLVLFDHITRVPTKNTQKLELYSQDEIVCHEDRNALNEYAFLLPILETVDSKTIFRKHLFATYIWCINAMYECDVSIFAKINDETPDEIDKMWSKWDGNLQNHMRQLDHKDMLIMNAVIMCYHPLKYGPVTIRDLNFVASRVFVCANKMLVEMNEEEDKRTQEDFLALPSDCERNSLLLRIFPPVYDEQFVKSISHTDQKDKLENCIFSFIGCEGIRNAT